ncbi:type II secretion system protein GspI, partial [Escherichia coli]|nr:type II secretion system protein GspI [Escherichia coli]
GRERGSIEERAAARLVGFLGSQP